MCLYVCVLLTTAPTARCPYPFHWGNRGTERLSNLPRVTEWCLTHAKVCISKHAGVSVMCTYACTCAWMSANKHVCVCVCVCVCGVRTCQEALLHRYLQILHKQDFLAPQHSITTKHTCTHIAFRCSYFQSFPKILSTERWGWRWGPAEQSRSREAHTTCFPGAAMAGALSELIIHYEAKRIFPLPIS